MHERLIEILACPVCRARLRLLPGSEAGPRGRVAAGQLECEGCGALFPVSNGIPRLLPELRGSEARADELQQRTAGHFTAEFTLLADDDRDMDPPEVLEALFFSRTGIDPRLFEHWSGDAYGVSGTELQGYRPDPAFMRGKRVLDAGCGPGRFTPIAARDAQHVVGLDLGAHVDRAARRCADLPNVDFVQGSVLAPPLQRGTFDFVFSIGVLHHTPDPRRGCLELGALLGRDGALAVWVYPPEYWGGPLRAPIGRAVHRWLSRLPGERSLEVCARWIYPIGRLQMALARRRWTKLLAAPLFLLSVPRHPKREVMIATIHDYFGPAIISTHPPAELEGWLAEAGFQRVHRLPVASSCLALRGVGAA
jgi:SAM-dependent methyltransferase/uncharacterized protein YbaR (Trm112 family)